MSQPTEGVQNNTDTDRSIKQNEKESENRNRQCERRVNPMSPARSHAPALG